MFRSKNNSILQWQLGALALCLLPSSLLADTIVSVQTNIGNFKLELFEDLAPATVTYFLANVEAGNYHFNMVHEASNTLMKSGAYLYNSCSEGPVLAPMLPSIPLESSGLSNSTGTVAMVPDQDDPTTLSGEWIINLGNNEAFLGEDKPVVFGEIVEGLSTVDEILDSWRVPMVTSLSVPTVNYDGIPVVQCGVFSRDNVIKVDPLIESVDPIVSNEAANVFNAETSMLNVKVDAGAEGLLGFSLSLQSSDPQVILQAQPETVVVLAETVEGIATFNFATNELFIPELVVEGEVAFIDLVLLLSDAENLFFTLQSFGTP